MNRTVMAMIGSLVALAGLLFLLRDTGAPQAGSVPAAAGKSDEGQAAAARTQPLHLLCAASNRAVMEAILADYRTECRVAVEVKYGTSQELLSTAEISGQGDLFLPADDSYLALAREKSLVEEIVPLARMRGVVAVRQGNPLQIKTLGDLLRDDVRTVQANPEAAAIAKMTRDVLQASGRWEELNARTAGFRGTVTDVANDVKLGAADAGIVFDAVLATYPELEAVAIPELEPVTAHIAVGVLKSTAQPSRALHLARFLAARDRGQVRYREFRFEPVDGDDWADQPEMTFSVGSMLHPVVEATIKEFERREGVKINTSYNGCGILVGEMQAGRIPDAYFACDNEFMLQVQDLFTAATAVSQNELIILVKKGNPHGVRSLADLARPGLRVGIGHEKQCAMGWLTQKTFSEAGLQTRIMPNVAVQSPTGDMLVNQMSAGSLDAAVVYLSNAAGTGDKFDAVRIEGIPCSVATQPFAIARDSRRRQLMTRLFERLLAPGSRERFEQYGFRWEPGADVEGP